MTVKPVVRSILVLLAAITVSSAPSIPPNNRSSYVCPPKFIRLSHRCYFFSKEKATWDEAYFQCQSMHSNLAIIKNRNQDKLIRKTLSRKTLDPLERWLGGRFDWQQRQWKWAASGKPLSYKGFDKSVNQDAENLQWSCMILDPALQFRWNSRSCWEERHFICHKKIQTVTNNKSRKKLLRQYNTNQLNEIPIPQISNNILPNEDDLKAQSNALSLKSDPFHIEIYPLVLDAQPAYRKKPRKNRKKKRKNSLEPALQQHSNGTIFENAIPAVLLSDQPYRRRRNKAKEDENIQLPMKIYYKTYKETNGKDPLLPNPIVEEYNLAKEI